MHAAIDEANRRGEVQMRYNEVHGITPKSVSKREARVIEVGKKAGESKKKLTRPERDKMIEELSREMREAASRLEFEQAAYLRDRIKELRQGN